MHDPRHGQSVLGLLSSNLSKVLCLMVLSLVLGTTVRADYIRIGRQREAAAEKGSAEYFSKPFNGVFESKVTDPKYKDPAPAWRFYDDGRAVMFHDSMYPLYECYYYTVEDGVISLEGVCCLRSSVGMKMLPEKPADLVLEVVSYGKAATLAGREAGKNGRGFELTLSFSDHISRFGNGYLAYGVNDRKIKGSITLTHSFNDKHYHPGERPLNNLSATYTYDIYSPEEIGEQHDIVTSLKTGAVKKLQYIRRINMTYEKQWLNSLRTSFWIENARYTPAWLPGPRGEGTLKYEMLTADGAAIDIPHITSTELGTQIVKLREMLMFNGVYGSLTGKNDPLRSNRPGLLLLPENTRPLGNMPYMEVGVGIENIFRLFRVMYFYRLTYRSDSMTWLEKWGGLRFGIYADF